MNLLHEVNDMGSNVDEYVKTLDDLLQKKIECISKLKITLSEFKNSL